MTIDAQAIGLSYLPLVLSRNPVVQYVAPLSVITYPTRTALRYELEVYVQAAITGNVFETLQLMRGSERPSRVLNGVTIYPGAEFDVRYLLDDRLSRSMPAFNQTKIGICDGLTRMYYTRSRRFNAATLIDTLTSTTKYVIKAGIAERDFRGHGGRFFSDLAGKFLTWQPNRPKAVRMDQPEYLYFVANATPAPTSLKLRVRINGSSVITLDTVTSLIPFGVYCLPVGPANPALKLYLNDAVTYYEVWLSNQSDARVSEVRRFDLDRSYRRNVRYLLFNNSLGGFDTLACFGQSVETLTVAHNVYERFDDYQANPSYAERILSDVNGERELTINTGPLRRDQADYLSELMLAEDVYLVTDRAHLPLMRTTNALPTHIDDEGAVARSLVFRSANRERNYSRLPAVDNPAGRPTGWRSVATACELTETGLRTGKLLTSMLEQYYTDTSESVLPPVLAPNLPTDPSYVSPVVGSPLCATNLYVNTAISRQSTIVRGNCATNQVGSTALITIAAGTFGSEISQADAQAKAEALYTARNSQTWVDANGSCSVATYQNTAISGYGSFYKNSCTESGKVGNKPLLTIAANTYGSNVSQPDAQARAQAAWNALNTQAYANANGACVDVAKVYNLPNNWVLEITRAADNSYVIAPRWAGGFGYYTFQFFDLPAGVTVSGQTLLVPASYYGDNVVAGVNAYHAGVFGPHGQYVDTFTINKVMH